MRWPDLSRLGIELRVFTGPPPLLVVRGSAADLAEHGFEQRGEAWVRSVTRFEATDLKRWFPDFAPGDIKEMAREQVVVSDVLSDVASELDSPRTGADHAEKNAQLDADFRLRSVEIIEALISRGDIAALYAAAGVRGPDAFDDLAMDDRAAAYIVFAGRNGAPALPAEDYNSKVARLERDATIRRLQSDQAVKQANGELFKSTAAARRFSDAWDLGDTHAVRESDDGYVLARLGAANRSSALQALQERQAADPAHQPVTVEDQGADRGAVDVAAEIARHIGGTDPREQAAKIKGLLHTNAAGLREVERSLKTAPEDRIIPLQTQAVQHEQNIAKLSQWLAHVEPNPEVSRPNPEAESHAPAPSEPGNGGAATTQDKAAPATDKNIGREWDSTYGRQKIVDVIPGKAEFGIQPMYEVQTAETGDIRRYSADKIEETIRGDEYRLTPEYEKEQAEKAEINQLRIERDARAKAKREAEDAEIAAFAASKRMAPPNAEKARAALTAQISANGTPISRKNLVEKLIAEGRTVGQFNGKRTLETSDGTFFDERQITKTGIDYAEYLIAKKSETKPAAPVAERAPTDAIAKQEKPKNTRFVVKDDGVETKVEWQHEARDGWERLTAFDSLDNAVAASKSQGYGDIPVFESEWSPSAKRFLPAKQAQGTHDTASDEVLSDQRGAQAQGAPALAAIAEHQPTRLGQRVVKILDAAAIRDRLQAEPDFELAIANPPFADLCVEALAGEGFTLTRYGQVENGDERVVDAEVVFHIDADGHLIVHETCSYSAEHGEVRDRDAKFADAMVKTLIEQGFAETEATRKEKARIEDAGEKIGGARKDQYHRITLDVLREMNDREKILYLKKDAIWPPISIDAAREAGVPVELLVMGREVRALVAPGIKDPAVAETYVRVVSGLRDAYAASTSPGEFISAIERMAIEVGVIEEREQKAYWGSDRMVKVRGTTSIYTDLQKAGWDYRKLNKIFWDPHVLSKKGRVFKEWCEQFPDADGYALLASRYARSGARVVEENDKIPSRPHLASIRRLGLPDERAGDMAAEDLIARFGFRGVEFGNWLPQDERQDVLNKAYDAFSTLAFVLGFPDKMMSLDGTLALAFGSRGKSRAAAHYEPGRTVINLTRMNGAGSTAHEFFHALDDWVAGAVRKHFAEKGDVGIPTDAMFATEFAIQRTKSRRRRPATTRATTRELRWHKDLFADVAPWFHMAASFLERTRTLDEIRHRLERKTAIWRDALERWARFGIRASGVSKEDAEKHAAEAVQELDTRALARLCDRLFGEDPDNHEKMLECVTGLREVQQAQAQIERHPESVQLSLATTDYFENAKLLDSKTPSKPYYSLARELGARAFECYVFDKLVAMEARDDYLVHGVEETRFSEGYRGNPYPAGADRLEINRRMEEALKKVAEKFVPSYTYETAGDLFAPVPRMAACR